MQIGVHVVDRDAVDANRSQQTAILRNAPKVGAHMAAIEKNTASGITAFNASVEVVPLVHPANGRSRSFAVGHNLLLLCDQLKNPKHAIEFATVRPPGEHP